MRHLALAAMALGLTAGITAALAVATVPGCAARAERAGVAASTAPYWLAAVAGDPADGCDVPIGCFARQPRCVPGVCFCGRYCQSIGGRMAITPGSRVYSFGGAQRCVCADGPGEEEHHDE